MKEKHIQIRVEQCLLLAKASNCPRRKFGALLLDPIRNVVLMDGYNGAPRGGGELCGGDCCLREKQNITSGTEVETGCHHAEMNVICNSAARGISTSGGWLFINGECCLLCSKLIHHAGIKKVIVINGGFAGKNGINYLIEHGILVEYREGPKDPRLMKGVSMGFEKDAEIKVFKEKEKVSPKLANDEQTNRYTVDDLVKDSELENESEIKEDVEE